MDFSTSHQATPGPSSHDLPSWPGATSSQYGSGKRGLDDADGDGGESDEDEEKPGEEAPKKRRRRQALSCTECKRRKIKCDRQHPCGPCVRRTEADKCHWNVVEPSDKYVLRTEWDGLQRRLETLERGKNEVGSQRRGDASSVKNTAPEANREPLPNLVRSPGLPSPSQAVPAHPDATAARISRLEAFIAVFAPEAWARFQAEEAGQSSGVGSDDFDRRGEGRISTSRTQLMDWRSARSEDERSSTGLGSTSLRAPRSEPSISPLAPPRREDNLPPIQPLSSHHASSHHPAPSTRHSPLPPHPYSRTPPTQHQDHYARPLLPRGSSDQLPSSSSSNSHFPGRSLDGPLPGPRTLGLGIVPGFGGPKSEGGVSSRQLANEPWDASLSSRVLPPPLPSPRSRASGTTSVSSTVFSEGRRPSDPSPFGRHDSFGSKHEVSKHTEPGPKQDRQDDPGPPQVFLSFPMSYHPDERAALLASVLGKSEIALEDGAVPSRTTCDKIVDYYFNRVGWNHNLIDPTAFREAYNAFFSTPSDKRHAPFIALLLAVLCVGLGNMTPERAIRENICKDQAHWKRRCGAYWRASQRALGANDIARSKPIELAQTLVMLLYCNQSLDDNGWEYSAHFIAFAVRIGHSMGLSKLGSETVGHVPPPGLRERELRRRVWWNIVFLDWYLSPSVGHSYLIHPAQCNTAFPANLDWEEMTDGRRFEPRPRDQWTGAAFLIAKAEVAESVRELSDHTNAGQALTYDFLLAYERRLNERLKLVAPCLLQRDHILERDDRVAWERIMLTIGLNNRSIRLHRRYMLRGYAVLEYRGSTEKCINAAKNMLHTYQEAQSIDFPGITWWVVCMHSFAAAVILLMDQFYARTAVGGETPPPAEMETRRRHIFQGISLLNAAGNTNNLARRAARVLGILADELTRRRGAFSPPGAHLSLSTSLPFSAMDRLKDYPEDAHLGSWVSTGLGPSSVPDGELQAAPVSARGMPPEIEAFWTRVFELDLPVVDDLKND
ncbi:putative transcriptional regulatory protein C1F7,11c OS=Schizosaccharomyces pombe (strain 972 / ATCC 24843) GN=SPAC1F7.11c PE=4 SV=1 [Rhizoctonia solani AG-1 IB]|uniref:Putative transcriptional regulatory protein C1F7,11c n=1 Tax=Thanatephorus cucumeris (strain AG1-IB / isolate 7/3/14) TaxID=1108050 RepID=A0A0B7FJ00_THACB|nr:putative transcriptional regulatory protein C1F7,11c OS=Schizosaccharomyces pombe (strain 972 / ATCC 24843) GN=SPAC1F7.11c PE=4 SV=1 [Rhizoctonia solani AG-1 IB]